MKMLSLSVDLLTTRNVNKSSMKIFCQWQATRSNKRASNEQTNSAVGIPDDILCDIPIPGDKAVSSDSCTISESFTRSVFNNCTIDFVGK